jgi:hypothetical protein
VSKDIKLLGLNVCGLKSKLYSGILEDYIKPYDFICLSESKLNPQIDFNVNGFKLFCKKIGSNNAHTIALLVNESLNEYVHVIHDVMSKNVLWLFVNKNVINYDFVLGTVYMPCEGSPIFDNDAYDLLTQDIIMFKNRFNNCSICLVGDFNSRTGTLSDFVLDTDNDIFTDRFYDNDFILSKCNLENCGIDTNRYNQDTCINNNGRKLIDFCKINDVHIVNGRFGSDHNIGKYTCKGVSVVDYFITSPKMFMSVSDFKVDVFDSLLSDIHSPICLTLSTVCPCEAPVNNTVEKNGEKNESNLPNFKVKWESILASDYVNMIDNNSINVLLADLSKCDAKSISAETVNNINEKIQEILLAPAKTLNMVKKSCKKNCNTFVSKPWYNEECKRVKSEYLYIKKRFKVSKSPGIKREMKIKGKELRNICRKNKRNYEKGLHSKLKCMKNNNPKEYWNMLNSKKKSQTVNCNISLQTFTDHFKKLTESEIVTDVEFVNDNDEVMSDIYCNINDPFSIDEVVKLCKSLKNNKACGNDLILNEFIKNCPHNFYVMITNFFNLVLNSGHVPEEWSLGLILPLYKKKGAVNDPNNYRGITLLSCMSKVFTALLNNRLKQFLEENSKLGQEQAGYRTGYSTTDHIYTLHTLIELYLSKGKKLYSAFVDYQKAFDLIDRSKLWQKTCCHRSKW